ncbi:MAG: thiamine diphosphokinase, partial [Clostridiales bacterium]|nr:thiamine diphosphokinase [Clostridiales bacterium]
MKVALILNGENLDTQIKEDIIICADGGYRHVVDKKVHAIIGDFDSLKIKP